MGKPITKKKQKAKQKIKLKEESKPKINKPEVIIESEPLIIGSLDDQWYNWKADQCPRCQSTESIDIPEYPTLVCKSCWENRCKSCNSVTGIKLDGTCKICPTVNIVG